jgi:hypothetical protein
MINNLFVATPMYGGMCYGEYTKSIANLVSYCINKNIKLTYQNIINESLITRGRNLLVAQFLETSCSHLLFIDADIGFDNDGIDLLLQAENKISRIDIVAGAYAKKSLNFERLLNQNSLESIKLIKSKIIDFAANSPIKQNNHNDLIEVSETGTGFMLISKELILKIIESNKIKFYKSDIGVHSNNKQIYDFFQCAVLVERYLSEDYFFCNLAKEFGSHIYIDPRIRLTHWGTYVYGL